MGSGCSSASGDFGIDRQALVYNPTGDITDMRFWLVQTLFKVVPGASATPQADVSTGASSSIRASASPEGQISSSGPVGLESSAAPHGPSST